MVKEKVRWSIERRIPIAYIIALLVQTAVVLIYITSWQVRTDMRITAIEAKQVAQDASNRDTEAFRREFIDKLARIEENTGQMRQSLNNIQSR